MELGDPAAQPPHCQQLLALRNTDTRVAWKNQSEGSGGPCQGRTLSFQCSTIQEMRGSRKHPQLHLGLAAGLCQVSATLGRQWMGDAGCNARLGCNPLIGQGQRTHRGSPAANLSPSTLRCQPSRCRDRAGRSLCCSWRKGWEWKSFPLGVLLSTHRPHRTGLHAQHGVGC